MHPSEELPEQETAVGGICGGESSSLLIPEDDVSRARLAPGAKETTYWDYSGSERWLPWMGYLIPMWTSRFKKIRPHMMRMFVHDRAETPLPKHPSLDTQPSNTGRPSMVRSLQWVAPLVHWQPMKQPFCLAPHWQPY
ncbi:hypothetical protein E2C01_042292 [Portunus trituberculatus]|uniref:Uncharacterized protein n=1 Tax=Portunus trituberculatus TaxID=210409 RepID=A0A5B7FUE2_PORTR|nr:hypothetical protein [Portunus trituberculatus]